MGTNTRLADIHGEEAKGHDSGQANGEVNHAFECTGGTNATRG